jgi:hypothetical protein
MTLAAGLVLLLATPDGGALSPPTEPPCLARHYAVTPKLAEGARFARLPDGRRVPFDDGKRKSFDERLRAPAVKDIFAIPYRPGPLRPVAVENRGSRGVRWNPFRRPRSGTRAHLTSLAVSRAFRSVTRLRPSPQVELFE